MSGFQKKPFFATPDANCFVPLPQYREALNALCDWARAGEGIALLTSPPGLGKTLLCHRLALELGDRVRTVFLANASFGTPRQLLQTVLFRLDRPYAHRDDHELLLEFWKALKSLDAENRMLLLIVDDAHELSEDVLREFRVMLSNPGIGNPGVLMLFSGQLELEETLARRSLSALNQRVKTHQILDLLTRDESAEYLAERLQWAGAEIEAVFEEGAVGLVTHLCDGVPRCLNVLAEACLKLAEKRGAPLVSETGVRESFSRVRHLPLHWNELPEVSSLSATELPVDPQSDPDSRTNQTPATRGAESLETPDETVEFVVAEFGEGIDDPTTETFAANVSDDESDSVLDDSDSEFRLDDTVLAQRVGSLAAPQTAEELPTPIPVAIPMSSKEEFLPNAPASGTDLETRETTPVSAALPPEGKSNRRASVPISHNPVDIFAPDLPAHGAGNASTSRDDISQEIPPSTPASFPIGESQVDDDMVDEYVDDETAQEDLQRDLERLLAEARAADELDAIEPEPDESPPRLVLDPELDHLSAPEYDVIVPVAPVAVEAIRPKSDLHLPAQPGRQRYRNLFRQLRRRREA